jgi:hypothetical protein
MIKNYNYIRGIGSFKTIGVGNLNDRTILMLLGTDGVYYATPFTPQKGNDLYCEAATGVTLQQDENINNLNLNGAQDIVRLNTNGHKLNIYGKLRTYSGSAPGTTDSGSTGSGIAGWIAGTLKAVGSANRTIIDVNEFTANARAAGWTLEVAFDAGTTAYIKNTFRCGFLVVTSGILDCQTTEDGLAASSEFRIAGNDYTSNDGTTTGTVIVKSGATLKFYRIRKNSATTAGNGILSFTLESGATLIPKKTDVSIDALSYDMSGTVNFNFAGAQNFINSTGVSGCSIINTYDTVILSGSGAKTLLTNTTINTLLQIGGTALLSLSTFTLTYGASANVEYLASTIAGPELPSTNTGFQRPLNVTVDAGVTLDLGGTDRYIRGTLTLGSGASVVNGTINQNQP